MQRIYRRYLSRTAILLPVCLTLFVLPALAGSAPADVTACFSAAAERHNIPAELLVSIAEVESGLKALALNRAGTAMLPRTREQAEQVVSTLARQSATFDVGIMQVNRWWFEKYGEPYQKGLDPCFNIDFGARILAMAIKDHGFTWQAVGHYHSPTSWRQDAYARKIFTRLARLLEKRRSATLDKIIAPGTNSVASSRTPDDPRENSASQ